MNKKISDSITINYRNTPVQMTDTNPEPNTPPWVNSTRLRSANSSAESSPSLQRRTKTAPQDSDLSNLKILGIDSRTPNIS